MDKPQWDSPFEECLSQLPFKGGGLGPSMSPRTGPNPRKAHHSQGQVEQISTAMASEASSAGPKTPGPRSISPQEHFCLLGQEAKVQRPSAALELDSQPSPKLHVEPSWREEFKGDRNKEDRS